MELDRRTFLKRGAILGGAAAITGIVGCSPKNEKPSSAGESPAAAEAADYKAKPAAIDDKQIKETIEADVVIVGAGNAGAVACATAVEQGASVILLQKLDKVFSHGSVWSATGSKLQAETGITTPGWKIMGDLAREGGNNLAKWEVMRNWVEYSGDCADFIMDLLKDSVYGPFIIENPPEASEPWNRSYGTTHIPRGEKIGTGRIMAIATALVEHACEVGKVEVRYNTPGVQLKQDDSGKVVGVIAKDENDNYILCKAGKGVILAAGGYESNEEMRKEFLPFSVGLPSGYSLPDVTTGDGILMGMWAGGQIQKQPHCSNFHYDPGIAVPTQKGTTIPWLRVNKNGERFSNEDVSYDEVWAQDIRQPGCMHYQVFDDNYLTDIDTMGKGMTQFGDWTTLVTDGVANGDIYSADTLEELAKLIDVPVESFKNTVARYNELAAGNFEYEPDFGKLGYKVKKIEKAPFYAIARQASALSTLSGLEVNGDLQVLKEDGAPIEGLYAAGNCSGNFFGGVYQRMSTPGMSVGRAFVTGRVAAWRACGVKK